MMNARLLTVGCLLWAVGTILIRLEGQHLLHTGRPVQTIALYLVSAIAMAIVVRRISGRYEGGRVNAAALLALPTLFLDPFSCLFFTTIFPNVDAAAAGLFGGWMLICCGGAIGGAFASR
ncbi:MAG: DUF5367 family protein [Thermoanaerobaculia bacterium]